MWTGAWAGGAAALAVLVAALLCRRRHKAPSELLHHVHIVRDAVPQRNSRARLNPRRPPVALPPPIPILYPPIEQSAHQQGSPTDSEKEKAPQPQPSTSAEYKGIPKLPLPEQFLHKRPFDYTTKYSSTIPRPLAQIASSELGSDLNPERNKKFSVTRSPSLEKDDKSPFLGSAKADKVFGFDAEAVINVERGKEMTDKSMSPKDVSDMKGQDMSPGNLRRFRSVSTKLNMCNVNETTFVEGQQEKLEMQNSPRILECSSAKEKSNAPKFDFSPRLLAESLSSPRFFTPPETVSPMFFVEPSPKSVYYDSVRSPKFFPETPRPEEVAQSPKVKSVYYDSVKSPKFFPETPRPEEVAQSPKVKSVYYDSVRSPKFFAETPKSEELPQSPRALAEHQNRSNGHLDKPISPRILLGKPRSPKVYSSNKENYFTFDTVHLSEDSVPRLSPRPKRYLGRNSIEKERFTPPADKEAKRYRRHNSCDTNYKQVEINVTSKSESIEDKVPESDKDVVDCCAKITAVHLEEPELEATDLLSTSSNSAQFRRQRLKSISLDSDNAKIIEQNLGLPIAKQMKDQMNEAYKNQDVSASCESMERFSKSPERSTVNIGDETDKPVSDEANSPDLMQRKGLRQIGVTQSFIDMPRFSPKEFEITVTTEEGSTVSAEVQNKKKTTKNLRNLTIDLTKRDSDLEKELLEFEKLYTDAEEKKVKTPTLKVKATSLDSSESVNLSLPQTKALEVPQNSVSVPNTPKRQLKRILAQKTAKYEYSGAKGCASVQSSAEQRRLYMKGQDSGIFLRENHASLMLYQPGTSRRTMGSFDENMADYAEATPEINISGATGYHLEPSQTLGSNLLNYKTNLSVSSTNLKTLPEGVTSDDFEPTADDGKVAKKLHRRNSNQSLMLGLEKYSTHSLQSSNCSLSSSGASSHNLASVRTSLSNFSLNTDNRQKKLSLERRDSNASMMVNTEHMAPTTRVICSSNTSLSGETQSKNCLLQRRGSNNSLTLNIASTGMSRHSSNSSLNKEAKPGQKKGLLERRSSNTSLTLNIHTSNPQLSVNKGLSISNYNLNGSSCNLSRYNSNQSIDNTTVETKKGILERRSSNTSLTLNIQPQEPQEPRDLEIDESIIDSNLKEVAHKHRKSLSTENLLPKSYKSRTKRNTENKSFGSHDNLWSESYTTEQENYTQNLTYVGGDQENEIIYAFGRQDDASFSGQGFVRNITTKPLSPQSTSEDFRLYLANMQHLQNASSVLSRQKLKDLNDVFQNGYSKVKCLGSTEGSPCCSGRVREKDLSRENPQMEIPEVESQPCSEYQKKLLRSLHQEFWDMPTNFQEKPMVSGSNQKNRYKTILPNEHSRFILQTDEGASAEPYINANFIKGHEYTKNSYIATQGPLQNTIYDFWLMVHQNQQNYLSKLPSGPAQSSAKVQKVVMLTNFIENGRQKCEKYFPLEINEEITFEGPIFSDSANPFTEDVSPLSKNSFTIKNSGMIKKTGYTIRKLNVKHKKTVQSDTAHSETTVYHYWFHNWADHKCPKDVNALLNLSLDILNETDYDFTKVTIDDLETCACASPKIDTKFVFPPSDKNKKSCDIDRINVANVDFSVDSDFPPTIIHCSAGIGRTGCLIAILNGIKQLSNEHKVDVLGIVCNMRLNRGGMVQNSEQYELIHKVLCLYEQACLSNL